jgi:hypothetical protein
LLVQIGEFMAGLLESQHEVAEQIGATYERRLKERSRIFDQRSGWDRRIADARLVIFCAALVMAILLWMGTMTSPIWLVVPFVSFVAIAIVHEPVRRSGARAGRAKAFYERGLARVSGQWETSGNWGLEYLNLDHPYAADLDLFGKGSMFDRLCTARTRSGEAILASWLVRPASIETIQERHAAIEELRPRLDLREELDIQGADVRAGIDPAALVDWGRLGKVYRGRLVVVLSMLMAISGTAAALSWILLETNIAWFFAALGLSSLGEGLLIRRNRTILKTLDRRTQDLLILARLLERLERETFHSSALVRLSAALRTVGTPASVRIRQLGRLLQLLDSQRNQIFFPVAVLWMWRTQIAWHIDQWRAAHGGSIGLWIAAVGELEALLALAAYSAENPADPFPELVAGPGLFEAQELGHPLLNPALCVRNDVSLGGTVKALLVSGSNMSGKSTLLRTVGINAVLALAGAPVRAKGLRVSPLATGATLRIQDSLLAGRSRFYAEIERVRLLVEISSGDIPLLFLLDELFHGTNSHDRCLGAEALIKGLIDRGAIGLLTTHDLALAAGGERLAPRVENVHFEDRLEEGKMHFDYRMRPGIVQHSNALALMRAIGLDV